jgi:hypothetical protein
MGRDLNNPEQAPIPNDKVPIWGLVIKDMIARNRQGIEKYKTPLVPFNGRNALVDLYQELLDACAYCRQLLEEQGVTNGPAATATPAPGDVPVCPVSRQ